MKRGSIMNFTLENSGSNTYLVYEIESEKSIDTVCMGMVTNNEIDGIIPFIFTQMDSKKYLKYNISSKITLERFLASTITKDQLLSVFSSMASAIMNVEDYMINLDMLLLDIKHIYVNIGTYQAEVIPLPFNVTDKVNLSHFFKMIMSSAQFDTTENSDYVGKIISFLNRPGSFVIDDFLRLIKDLKSPNNAAKAYFNAETNNPADNFKVTATPKSEQNIPPYNPPPIMQSATPPPIEREQSAQEQRHAHPPTSIDVPSGHQDTKQKKKGLFSRKKSIEKRKSPSNNAQPMQFAVPGAPVTVPQASGASPEQKNISTNQSPVIKVNPSAGANAVPQIKNAPVTNGPQNSNTIPTRNASFGETTVLNSDSAGETTVLADSGNSQSVNPHLIRSKTNQVTFINAPVLRIGAEKSYVDLYLGDNPAISRSHADITVRDNKYYIVDNNSTNQTYVNYELIPPGTEIEIFHGTIITLADEKFEFNLF